MAYRTDPDLAFLGELKSEDLNELVYCVTHNNNGDARLTEQLTVKNEYKSHNPDHIKYWKIIAEEIQCFGANSFATLFRGGEGVLYREVLTDVCDKLKVNYNKESSVAKIENNLLLKIISDSVEKMSKEELQEFANATGLKNSDTITSEIIIASLQAIFKAGGFKSYQYTAIIVNIIWKAIFGRGLPFVVTGPLMKAMSILTGPIGWAITGLWTAIDVAGPAYRVTIPAVIQVAFLRQLHLSRSFSE